MRRLIRLGQTLLYFAAAALVTSAPVRGQPAPATLVLTNARVVDPVTGLRAGLADVTIRGRVIERVERAGGAATAGAQVIDLAGRWCAPAASSA